MSIKKRLVSIITAVIMVISCIPVLALSSGAAEPTFEEFVIGQFEAHNSTFDITTYALSNKWDVDDCTNAVLRVMAENPSLFYVTQKCTCKVTYKIKSATGEKYDYKYTISGIKYSMTKAEFEKSQPKYEDAVEAALSVIQPGMTDVEKALALHDFLVLNNKYDTSLTKYTAYNALVEKTSVCEGYSAAYIELLERVGIEAKYVRSKKLNHTWNYVNLDGEWYHVDVTSDDPLYDGKYDLLGNVKHNFFLITDAELMKLQTKLKSSKDWDTGGLPAATSKTYSKAFWKDKETALQKAGDSWYWIELDETSPGYKNNRDMLPEAEFNDNFYKMYSKIMKYDFASNKESQVYRFYSTWFSNGTENEKAKSWHQTTFAKLHIYDGRIYFNTAKEIQSVDLTGKNLKTVVSPKLDGKYIFGFNMNDNKIEYTLKTTIAVKDNIKTSKVDACTSEDVTLSKTKLSAAKGKSYTLKATLDTAGDNVYWASSDVSVATVSSSGKVSAKAKGTCNIYAFTDSGAGASCKVTVK